MRGQGPGSEHESRDAGGAPPTPPPSFGRRPPSDPGGPSAFPDDPAARAWLTVDGEPREDAWQPTGAAPADTWLSVQEPTDNDPPPVRDSAPQPYPSASTGAQDGSAHPHSGTSPAVQDSSTQPSPDVRDATAQPVPHASPDVRDSAPQPYPGTPSNAAHSLPGAQPWEVQAAEGAAYDWHADDEPAAPASPTPPDEPRWEPPPAFTAAAAGMQVWPTPATGSPPPWPAATGELEPDDDTPALQDGAQHTDPSGTWPARPVPHQPSAAPEAPEGRAAEPRHPVPLSAPTPADQDAPPAPNSPYAKDAVELYPAEDPRPPYGVEPTRPSYDQDEAPTRPGHMPRPGPLPSTGRKGPPAPLFDPKLSPAAQQGAQAAPTNQSGPSPEATPPVIGAHPENAPDDGPSRRTEPGDVPVWPPTPQGEDQDQLDLPFAPEVWGRRSTPETSGDEQQPAEHPPGSVIQGVPIPPPTNIPRVPPPQANPGAPDNTHPPQKPAALQHATGAPPQQGPAPLPAGANQGELPPPANGDQGGPYRQQPFAPIEIQPQKSKRALFATLGVLVLAGVATGGFFAVRSADTSAASGVTASARTTPPAPQPTAAATPAQPAGSAMLNSEITDPKTLSLKEAFPDKKIKLAGATFTRVKTQVADDCTDAASGPFAAALKEQKCSRVLRATYVDGKRRYAVTTGIAVLPSKDAAVEVDQAKDLGRNLWFRGLAGPDGSGGDRVHIAGGYAAGLVWGRYIVFSYATHADGHTPDGKEKALVKVSGEFRDETAKVLERRVNNS